MTQIKDPGSNRGSCYRKSLKSLVVCTVRYEPVSDNNSLLTGKFTGNFAISDRFGRDATIKTSVPQ
jgi:hypothetical protein